MATEDCGVYMITSPEGHKYIGSSIHIKRRWQEHKWALRHNKHNNVILQRVFDKYGWDNLKFEKLLICEPKDTLMYEQICIDFYKPEYNITKIAGSPMTGRKASDETRAKMSATRKGRKHSKEARQAMREVAKQRPRAANGTFI